MRQRGLHRLSKPGSVSVLGLFSSLGAHLPPHIQDSMEWKPIPDKAPQFEGSSKPYGRMSSTRELL